MENIKKKEKPTHISCSFQQIFTVYVNKPKVSDELKLNISDSLKSEIIQMYNDPHLLDYIELSEESTEENYHVMKFKAHFQLINQLIFN